MHHHSFPTHSFIATTNSILTIGQNYDYTEGSTLHHVQLLTITETDNEWRFQLQSIESGKTFVAGFAKDAENIGYGGMWRLCDYGSVENRREKIKNHLKRIEERNSKTL